ncbi:MAG TPA: GYD domain-containing protein [Dehalococcoidia bacterium]|nr:GYD domain-containing protein [Dehalococcoidia bacterium]
MAKYLVKATYSQEGLKGVIKGGGSARRAALTQSAQSVGGKLEAFYFAFGKDDVYLIVDAPDNVSVAALTLAAGASGSVSRLETVVLLTPEEVDQAAKKTVTYRAPGQ